MDFVLSCFFESFDLKLFVAVYNRQPKCEKKTRTVSVSNFLCDRQCSKFPSCENFELKLFVAIYNRQSKCEKKMRTIRVPNLFCESADESYVFFFSSKNKVISEARKRSVL